MIHHNAWDDDVPPEYLTLESARPPWLDRLVDLHVLSEHGDTTAADTADQWISADPDARRVWDEVQHCCEGVRAVAGETSTPA